MEELTQEKSIDTHDQTIRVSKKKLLVLLFVLACISLAAVGALFYSYHLSKIPTKSIDNEANGNTELSRVLALVEKLAVLPHTDDPVLVKVSNPTDLRADAFFNDSEVGDDVIIYPHIGRAFLYRQSVNKIINITTFTPSTGGANGANQESNIGATVKNSSISTTTQSTKAQTSKILKP